MPASIAAAGASSTPSATTLMPSPWARSIVERINSASRWLPAMPRTKALSIFSSLALILKGPGQDEFGERTDVAGLLGHGDEEVRRQVPAFGMRPTDQRLHGGDLAGAQIVLGLVVDRQEARIDGCEHLAHQGQVRGR